MQDGSSRISMGSVLTPWLAVARLRSLAGPDQSSQRWNWTLPVSGGTPSNASDFLFGCLVSSCLYSWAASSANCLLACRLPIVVLIEAASDASPSLGEDFLLSNMKYNRTTTPHSSFGQRCQDSGGSKQPILQLLICQGCCRSPSSSCPSRAQFARRPWSRQVAKGTPGTTAAMPTKDGIVETGHRRTRI